MLYYDKIDLPEGIDVNQTSSSKDCDICHYRCFLGEGFTFQLDACNGCHEALMMSMNLSDIAILYIHRANYRCIISKVSKSDAVNLMQNIDLSEKQTL